MRFTLYLERDVALEVRTDQEAAAIATAIDADLDALLGRWSDGGAHELAYGHATCHRGHANKIVFEREQGQP